MQNASSFCPSLVEDHVTEFQCFVSPKWWLRLISPVVQLLRLALSFPRSSIGRRRFRVAALFGACLVTLSSVAQANYVGIYLNFHGTFPTCPGSNFTIYVTGTDQYGSPLPNFTIDPFSPNGYGDGHNLDGFWSGNNPGWVGTLDPNNPDRYSCFSTGVGWYALGAGTFWYGNGTISVDIYSTAGSGEYLTPNDLRLGGDDCADSGGMARYSVFALAAGLSIRDTPIRYTPPRGPAIDFTVRYSQRERQQPSTFTYSNFGPKWTCNWISYVIDDPPNPAGNAYVYVAGGGVEDFSGFDSSSQTYLPDPQSHAVLVRTSSGHYEKRFPDGSKQIFSLSNGATSFPRKIFMTQTVDPAGNAATIGYDANLRITTITDALSKVTGLSYDLPEDNLKVTKVTDPFGRFATFSYTNGQLTAITDQVGIQSQFAYTGDFINSLTTPYGTSSFATNQSGSNNWIEMTDPLGGKERVEYRNNAPGIVGSDPSGTVPQGFTNSGLDYANTFYWTKKAIQLYPPVNGVYDYTKARLTHWTFNSFGSATGIPASERPPLENRVWYAYAGQSDTNHPGTSANPTKVARVLDGGTTTQLWQYEYNNSFGKMTKSIDARGRVLSYIYYPNDIDLKEARQTTGSNNDLLRTLTYNTLHEPLNDTDAAGQTTIYTYRPDGHGQLQSVQNAKGETTTYSYGPATDVPADYLASITSPMFNSSSAVTNFTYDSANRVRTVTSLPDNYAVTADYDNLDRPTTITYPDGTTQTFGYTQDFGDGRGVQMLLDATTSTDRRGRRTTRHYDKNRHVDSITEPFAIASNSTPTYRTTLYGWCTCGALTSITDPRGKITTFDRDLQSRVTRKLFADNTAILYGYENTTSRLKSITDPLNQSTNYSYYADDTLQQISYTNAINPTPNVSFNYDDNYNRIRNMTDGVGTTSYEYYTITSPPALGAGRLKTVDGPFNNDAITYAYDELGRVLSQSINGVPSAITYDSLGRLDTSDNVLGHFSRTYDGTGNVTPRLKTLSYPNGQTANYTYFDKLNDMRLQTLQNLGSGGVNLSQFDYSYDAEGQIRGWLKRLGINTVGYAGRYSYDLGDELTGADLATLVPPYFYSYRYDASGNRTIDQLPPGTHTFNDVNQTQDPGYVYDRNGNLTSDGVATYSWDAANRLIAVERTQPGTADPRPTPTPNPCDDCPFDPVPTLFPPALPVTPTVLTRSEFSYDGLGRRVRVVERQGNNMPTPVWVTVSDHVYVWSGTTLAEEREPTASGIKRFFAEGEQINGQNYYYTRDHLGSIREMTDSNGTVHARYEYDPFGLRTRGVNDVEADFGFTGYWHHSVSGLELALYRAYSPTLGRWLSRDPIGEEGGLNLYAYVFQNPINWIDPLGLDLRLETTNQVHGLHQRVSVDTPSGPYAQSFGMSDANLPFQGSSDASGVQPGVGTPGSGVVYPDTDPTRTVVQTYKMTPEEDAIALGMLQRELNQTGPYHVVTRSCRNYSQERFYSIVSAIEQRRIDARSRRFREWILSFF
jgi:RHS repeat-associated protein